MRKANKAIAPREQKLNQSTLNKFKEWLRYLRVVSNRPESKQLLFNYYFEKFASSPQLFYMFLEYFKKNLRGISAAKAKKDLAQKYLDILSPLCERFNFFEEKSALDDLCFSIVNPEEYREIKELFAHYEKKSKKIVSTILQILDNLLKKNGFDYKVVGRYKNIYSIHLKIRNRGKKNLKMNDIFAFRIILNRNITEECFKVVNLLHDTFYPIPDLFKDYVNIPKINGYQSLHTGLEKVIEGLDLPVEVQIRTREMHEFAENGIAAHWLYSQDKKSKLVTQKERQLLDYLSCIAHTSENENYVHCFSYTGDMIKMPRNSTILDFGYQIHTALGNKIKSAIVNNQEKNLYYRIKEGDQIQIIQSEENQIEQRWLNYAHTRYAQKKISEYLKRHAKKTA